MYRLFFIIQIKNYTYLKPFSALQHLGLVSVVIVLHFFHQIYKNIYAKLTCILSLSKVWFSSFII